MDDELDLYEGLDDPIADDVAGSISAQLAVTLEHKEDTAVAYGDIHLRHTEELVRELQAQVEQQKVALQQADDKVTALEQQVVALRTERVVLLTNMSSLFRTAEVEVKRWQAQLAEARKEARQRQLQPASQRPAATEAAAGDGQQRESSRGAGNGSGRSGGHDRGRPLAGTGNNQQQAAGRQLRDADAESGRAAAAAAGLLAGGSSRHRAEGPLQEVQLSGDRQQHHSRGNLDSSKGGDRGLAGSRERLAPPNKQQQQQQQQQQEPRQRGRSRSPGRQTGATGPHRVQQHHHEQQRPPAERTRSRSPRKRRSRSQSRGRNRGRSRSRSRGRPGFQQRGRSSPERAARYSRSPGGARPSEGRGCDSSSRTAATALESTRGRPHSAAVGGKPGSAARSPPRGAGQPRVTDHDSSPRDLQSREQQAAKKQRR